MTDQRDPGDASDLPVLSVTHVADGSDLPVLRDSRGHLLPGTASIGASRRGRRNKRTLMREAMARDTLRASLLPSVRGLSRTARGLPLRRGDPPPLPWLVTAAQKEIINLFRPALVDPARDPADLAWVEYLTEDELAQVAALRDAARARMPGDAVMRDDFGADSVPPPALPAPAAQQPDEFIIDVPAREAPE